MVSKQVIFILVTQFTDLGCLYMNEKPLENTVNLNTNKQIVMQSFVGLFYVCVLYLVPKFSGRQEGQKTALESISCTHKLPYSVKENWKSKS